MGQDLSNCLNLTTFDNSSTYDQNINNNIDKVNINIYNTNTNYKDINKRNSNSSDKEFSNKIHQINFNKGKFNLNKVNHNNIINLININGSKENPKLIWIDYNINKSENIKYQNILKNITSFKGFNSIELGLEEIKKIKFERVIIILSKSMFNDFIPLFDKEKNNICCSLNIIVFTKKSNKILVEEICNNNKDISAGYIFDKKNIFEKFSQIIDFIENDNKRKSKTLEHFVLNEKYKFFIEEKNGHFSKIEDFEELILPIYLNQLIEPITFEEINNFNYYLLNSFKKDYVKRGDEHKRIDYIISQIENNAKMPIEIVCKYWARIYTSQNGQFYSVLNNGLKKNNFLLFFPFIKMMYEGIRKKIFSSVINLKLYSGGIISKIELEKLKNNLENLDNNIINNNLLNFIYYFKSFESFSKNIMLAKKFMNIKKRNLSNDSKLLLFIIEEYEKIEGEFISNIDIQEYSLFKKEEEVLFLPFSSFEVVKIVDKVDYAEVYLKYLGRFKSYIEENKSKEKIFKDLPINQFGRDITKMGLIKYKFSKFWEIQKEIKIEENATCILSFEKNKILFSIGNNLKLYDLENDKNLLNINIHKNKINNLLKINENTFITSS